MRGVTLPLVAALLATGCALIVGIDDHRLGTSGSGGSGAVPGTGGGPSNHCAPPDVGPTACTGSLADCDGDGTCETDLSSDGTQCGVCHHDCLGGDCVSGVCQDVQLSPEYGMDEAFGPLTVFGGDAYYVAGLADDNTIYTAPDLTPGSPIMVSAKPVGQVAQLAVYDDGNGRFLVATTFAQGAWGLWGMIADGGEPQLIQPLGAPTTGLAARADGTVFVAELSRIVAFNATTTEIAHASGSETIQGLAVDDTHVYWASYAEGSGAGKIRRATLQGKDEIVIADKVGQPEAVAVDGTRVYWTDSALGTISSAPKSGGTVRTLANGQVLPKSIAVDGNDLYWSAAGGVYHLALCASGNAPVQITIAPVGAIGLDADRVVVTDTHVHQVLGFAR